MGLIVAVTAGFLFYSAVTVGLLLYSSAVF